MTKKPAHIIVTTPESLYILLTSEGGRRMLSTVRTLIVDEIHAMVDDKRGSHLSLSIERLEALVRYAGRRPAESEAGQRPAYPLVRVGLSATQKPIAEVARFLVGTNNIEPDGSPRCTIIDTGQTQTRPGHRSSQLIARIPHVNEVWEEITTGYTHCEHKTTLVC
jgi:ATP-dependent Lhr-like helicase